MSVMREAPTTQGAPMRTRAQSKATKRRKSPLRESRELFFLAAATALGPAGLSGCGVEGEIACTAAARGLPNVRDAAAAAIHDTGDSIGLSPAGPLAGSMLRSGSGSRAARRGAAMVRIGAATAAGRELVGGFQSHCFWLR